MRLLKAFLAQILGLIIALVADPLLPDISYDNVDFFILQSSAAILISLVLRQPRWWILIHCLFLPSVFFLLSFHVSAYWYLLVLCILGLVFWGTIKGDVPLFLSSTHVTNAVIELVYRESAVSFAELGAGIGTITVPLAKQYPHLIINAWERAPLPWLINIWRNRLNKNSHCFCSSLWDCDFDQYDVIFTFLSPVLMPEIGVILRNNMRPGSLLISAAFPVPGWEPELIKQLNNITRTQLYCYRITD